MGSTGYRYEEQTGKSSAQIAAMIRRDIKQAVADGLLPARPVRYSVRTHTYSGGASINVTVQGWPEAWQDCDGYVPSLESRVAGAGRDFCPDYFCAAALAMFGEDRPGAAPHRVLTADARVAEMTLERIHQAYNHNNSDTMTDYFDVNYYGGVHFDR